MKGVKHPCHVSRLMAIVLCRGRPVLTSRTPNVWFEYYTRERQGYFIRFWEEILIGSGFFNHHKAISKKIEK
jgi:hypothetical protein